MKAVQLTHFGAPEALTLTDMAAPTPGPGQVVVTMEASGINFAETLMREDRYAFTPPLPCVLGSEVVGVVAALGPGVTGLAVGDRVAAALFAAGVFFGGYAEQVVVDADFAVPLPAGLPADQACALMVQGLTALALTRHAPVQGRSVLVTAAAGGVGALLVQLLCRAGARQVIGAASTDAKRQHVLALGADAAIDYTLADWPQQLATLTDGAGPDVVFDSVGGTTTAQCLASLASNGTMVVFGALNIQSFSMGVSELVPMIFKNQALKGFALVPLLTAASLREDLQALAELALQAQLVVDIGGRYPLSETARAHRDLAGRQVIGKLVLLP
ncbi:MAG: NADPH:quinone oxidoreductase [Burkholderiales bacterium PBB5]|nr:MAG: NADPH:quinone oxidoreductase [Burkholderiales bacterium PBB5]